MPKKALIPAVLVVLIVAVLRMSGCGATAVCRDGSYSWSKHRTGTCSGHGGVAEWR